MGRRRHALMIWIKLGGEKRQRRCVACAIRVRQKIAGVSSATLLAGRRLPCRALLRLCAGRPCGSTRLLRAFLMPDECRHFTSAAQTKAAA